MSPEPESKGRQLELANLAAAIERAEVDLALGEEPAAFIAALEGPEAPEEAGDDT